MGLCAFYNPEIVHLRKYTTLIRYRFDPSMYNYRADDTINIARGPNLSVHEDKKYNYEDKYY